MVTRGHFIAITIFAGGNMWQARARAQEGQLFPHFLPSLSGESATHDPTMKKAGLSSQLV